MLTVQHDNVKMHNPNSNLTGGMVMSNPLQFAMYTKQQQQYFCITLRLP